MRCSVLLALLMLAPFPSAAQKIPPATRPSEANAPIIPPSPRRRAPIVAQVYVGEGAPDFELDGSRGRPVQLSSLRGTWIVLAFADRRQSLAGLRAIHPELGALGAQLVGVCHEKPGTLVSSSRRDSLPFLMLADVTGEISAMYGLYDLDRSATVPGFLVLDRQGVVRMAVLGKQLPSTDISRLARLAITGL